MRGDFFIKKTDQKLLKIQPTGISHMMPISRKYLYPIDLSRSCCPRLLPPLCEVTSQSEETRRDLTYKCATAILVHPTKENQHLIPPYEERKLVDPTTLPKFKNSLCLESIHKELEQAALPLQVPGGASNILVSKLSFDCFITNLLGEEERDYICFDLKIPGTGTEKNPVLSYEQVEGMYEGKENLYAALEYFYDLGRSTITNGEDETHGHRPNYSGRDSSHDQFIRHTEQLLVAYLASEEASEMIKNRLRGEIRAKYSDAIAVKVYSIGLHMHSTKTCCAPCEYTLIGLMNAGCDCNYNFLRNFERSCLFEGAAETEILKLRFPKHSPFQLLVTVSATTQDPDHRKEITYDRRPASLGVRKHCYLINIKDPMISKTIFTMALFNGYDREMLSKEAVLTDKTVGISGSKITTGTPKTKMCVNKEREKELDNQIGAISLLRLTDI